MRVNFPDALTHGVWAADFEEVTRATSYTGALRKTHETNSERDNMRQQKITLLEYNLCLWSCQATLNGRCIVSLILLRFPCILVLPLDMVDKSTSPLPIHFGPFFGDEAVQASLLFPA